MRLLKSLTTVGGFTMGSRVLGFVRDKIVAWLLGAGEVSDALVISMKIPSLLRRLLAEGAFNAAFLPMFSVRLSEEGKKSAKSFAEEVLAVLVVCLIAIVIIAEILIPYLIPVFAPGFIATPERLQLAIEFTRITFPFILFISLTALYSGILNSLDRFAVAAASPMLGNTFVICFVLALSSYVENTGALFAAAILGCGIVQFLAVLLPSHFAGIALKLRRPSLSPKVKQFLKRMAPAALGSGVHQINVLIGTFIASILPVGGMSILYYAERLNQLPLSVIGTAMGTVLLPYLTKVIRQGNNTDIQKLQNQGLELAMLMTVPAMVGLIVLAEPLIKMLFQGGAFNAEAARLTSYALIAYSLGLPAYVLAKIFNTSFYAQQDTSTPLQSAGVSVVVDIVLSVAFLKPFGHVGIALAAAISAWVNVVILGYLLMGKGYFKPDKRLAQFSAGLALSTVTTGVVLWFLKPYCLDMIFAGGSQRALSVSFLVISGLTTFVISAQLTQTMNIKQLKEQFKGTG